MLRSSEAAAIETLNERPVIALDAEAYSAFVAALDAPVEPNNRLQELLGRQPLWGALTAPKPLNARHDVSHFDCGAPSLNTWLRRQARLNEAKGGARTYVVCDRDRVVAFYSLAASFRGNDRRVSSRVGRSMPEPVPVILLGQLAVDAAYQGRGLGAGPADRCRH